MRIIPNEDEIEKGYYDNIHHIVLFFSCILKEHETASNVTNLGPNQIKFKWSVAMESAVDSSFFWGYLITQIPGGFLASMFPANRIFGTAIACSAFLNMFLPGAFEFPGVIICIRVLQGLVEVKI